MIWLTGLMLIVGCNKVRYNEAFYPEGTIHSVVVDMDVGNVELVQGDKLRVERIIRGPEGSLDLSHSTSDGVLSLNAHCVSFLPCAVDTQITVLQDVSVSISLNKGDVWATGINDLAVELATGDIDAQIDGPLRVQLGRGDIQAHVGHSNSVSIAVGKGDIDVVAPEGAWKIDATASSVRVDDSLNVSSASPANLMDLMAPSGSIQVRSSDEMAVAW